MNKQEVFDAVVKGAFEQKMPAISTDEGCLYRAPDGKKCFVGMLIPDTLYSKEFEGTSASAVLEQSPKLNEMFVNVGGGFLNALQRIHDETSSNVELYEDLVIEHWDCEFKKFAEARGLKYNARF